MGYEAILFDMDGVIVDTYQSVTEFWQNLAEVYPVHLTQADFNQHVYGCPATHTLDFLFPHLNAGERHSVLAKMADYETNLTYTGVKGAMAFLRTLKQQGIPTALVTSGAQWKVNEVINQLGIDGMFTAQVTAGDIQRGKPQPECYLLAAQYLQKPPEQCIVFEDSISGVKAAVASGALCIGLGPSSMASPLLQAGARYIVPDFSSIGLLSHEDDARTALILRIGAEHSLPLSSNQEEVI
ncbi:MAG: HAD family phosphatase [Anaerolineales bacterium]|nr:MAG: HAD family phosphatase [Anaerolineales bacterium]